MIRKICEALGKRKRIILGMMSGTSADGVDLALVEISGCGLNTEMKTLRTKEVSYPVELAEKIKKAIERNGDLKLKDVCMLDFELGNFYGECAKEFIESSPFIVDVVASHGQTVYHLPPLNGKNGCTLQLGDGDVIASRCGVLTITDFRRKDMAFGGQGAPLVVHADYVIYRRDTESVALNNLGGISNVTYIPRSATEQEVIGFDTGPANALIDLVVQKFFAVPFDKDGKLSAQGRIVSDVLEELKEREMRYISKKPPKSTGKEVYNESYLEDFYNVKPVDLLRTVVEFTAWTIWESYRRYIFNKGVDKIVLSGGGVKNETLVNTIRRYFRDFEIGISDDWKFKEAKAFALLANELLCSVPANVPNATGASQKTLLGKISLP